MHCLHCGNDGDNVIRMPGTRLSKRIGGDPGGFYYFILCHDCRSLPTYEYPQLMLVHPERVVQADKMYHDNDEALAELF